MLICMYASSISAIEVLHPMMALKNGGVAEKTLGGYIHSAYEFIISHSSTCLAVYHSVAGKATLHPFLNQLLANWHKWREPSMKEEPFTFPMFDALFWLTKQNVAINPVTTLDCAAAIFDWTCLGLHMGCHLLEYGQGKTSKGRLFATVPTTPLAGKWAGLPLAFIQDDFPFYNAHMCGMSMPNVIESPSHAM